MIKLLDFLEKVIEITLYLSTRLVIHLLFLIPFGGFLLGLKMYEFMPVCLATGQLKHPNLTFLLAILHGILIPFLIFVLIQVTK